MASESGSQNADLDTLVEFIREHGLQHFFASVSFLERARPMPVRVGEIGPVADEPIRFRHDSSLAFSTSDVSAVARSAKYDSDLEKIELTTTFLGLTGVASPLPAYFVEEVEFDSSNVLKDFLDLFHHRLISLFYRALARFHYARDFNNDATDLWSERILALAGVGVRRHSNHRLLRLSPLLARTHMGAASLRAALRDVLDPYLGAGDVSIEQFIGEFVPIDVSDQVRLGQKNSLLGQMVIGEQIFDRSSKFRIRIGPLGSNEYRRFQQDADLRSLVASTTLLFLRDPIDFDVALQLSPNALSGLVLSSDSPARLGQDTFLGAVVDPEVTIDVFAPTGEA